MDRKELKCQLDLLKIDEHSYSLNGELNPDTVIMHHSYHNWEVFYLDERGGRNNEKIFTSEDEACKYFYKLFKDAREIEDKYL